MLKTTILSIAFMTGLLMLANTSFAEDVVAEKACDTCKTSAVMSNNCAPEKLKELAGEGFVKVNDKPNNPDGKFKSYNITLDTTKTTFADLTKKMMEAKCF
jgi:hypothetical protein